MPSAGPSAATKGTRGRCTQVACSPNRFIPRTVTKGASRRASLWRPWLKIARSNSSG